MLSSTLAACGLVYSLIATSPNQLPEVRQEASNNVDAIVNIALASNQLEQVSHDITILTERLVAHPEDMPAFLHATVPICEDLDKGPSS